VSHHGLSSVQKVRALQSYKHALTPVLDPQESKPMFFSNMSRTQVFFTTYEHINTGSDLSVWRPLAGSLLEAPTHPQML